MRAWLLLSISAVVLWGLWAVIPGFIGDALTEMQKQALSTLGMLPVIALLGASTQLTATGQRRRGCLIAFTAGILACAGNTAYFYAYGLGGNASSVVPLTALYPLVTILLAMIFLRERLNVIQVAGVALAVAAIWCFNVPSVKGAASAWLAFALIPIGLWGVSALLQKISTNHVSGELSALWFLSAFVPAGALLFWWDPLASTPALKTWLIASAIGFCFSMGNYALLAAFARGGKASILAPLTGLYPVVSIPIAIVFFHESIGGRKTTGIVLAILAVVAMAFERPARPPHSDTDTSEPS
jgi:transporter family protein